MRISRWLADYEPVNRCAGRAQIFDRIKIRSSARALRGTMTRSGVSDLDKDAAVSIEAGAAARRNDHTGIVFLHHEWTVSRLGRSASRPRTRNDWWRRCASSAQRRVRET